MRILVTGGAGFVGSNIATKFMERGDKVIILDNLSRPGASENLQGLKLKYKPVVFVRDISSRVDIDEVFGFKPDVVIHCAAQTSLRGYLDKPYEDFQTNVRGTLNLLEASRNCGAHFIFFSTNKVYGDLLEVPVVELPTRYDFRDIFAISESQPIKPHIDPYSCSKATADFYCQIYSKFIKVTTLRCSTLYGPMQWPMPGQGWVGMVTIEVIENKVRIAGNGKQVRDILYIDDLVNLMEAVIDKKIGGVFNIGGGRGDSMSILELIDFLSNLGLGKPKPSFTDWHSWTQKVYISDISKISKEAEWKPKVGKKGIERYIKQWLLPVVLPQGLTRLVK